MKVAKWTIGIGLLVLLAAVVAVGGDRADRYQNHDWGLDPPDPWAGMGANLPGTVIAWQMDAQAPLGWAIYRDENGDYWKVRFAECDRVAGFTCPREVLYRYPIRPTRSL